MPRDIPVGNGKLLVCFDRDYCIRDLYFPHVGQENHVEGNVGRLGVWADHRFSWIGQGWKRDLKYVADSLVTEVGLFHKDMQVLLTCQDAVDFHENVLIREIFVENLSPHAREIRLFFSNDFNISGNDVGDTAALDPKTGAIVHYKAARYFLIGGRCEESEGLSQFAVGQKGIGGKEGTFKDAEDGELSGNPIAQGTVDSVVSLTLHLKGNAGGKAWFWMAAGEDWTEVRRLDGLVKRKHPEVLISRTREYWYLWSHKETPRLDVLPEIVGEQYRRSLLVLRTQIDWQGGILAANDSDVIQFNRDTYSYVWPRDGALVANALDLAGYDALAQNFYKFVADIIEPDGYVLHKYNPDGTLASSWHPWWSRGKDQLPIQEDETALVIWALWQHFVRYRDVEFIKPLYKSLIKNSADFMCRYRDEETGLPAPSYDLWEERRGILSFTVAAVFGGITAASLFCTVFGDTERADYYRKEAAHIRDAASTHLWRPELNRFCRMISRDDIGALVLDPVRDASVWGLYAFGLYSADDPKITATMSDLKETLWIKTDVGGMARYEDDYYHRASHDFPGNPWFICTMWMADYLTERASNDEDLTHATEILEWVAQHALPSGVLAEQVHPLTGQPLSVSPLTWSHATFIASTQKILRKMASMHLCNECGAPLIWHGRSEDWIEKMYSEACDAIYGACRV
jgi:glucoamylase